ncbi:hypothetical protein GYH30_009497 [Glycine max]|uniref:Uncharacterized protein n=1 Tax=Glycine max TaxID=3847 RepID=K7KJ88_SOYBN|nr:hypothetical protein GYH30_009497 [Glycine max]
MGKYVLEGKVITGSKLGMKIYISKLSITPSNLRIPFKFERSQLYVDVSRVTMKNLITDNEDKEFTKTFNVI